MLTQMKELFTMIPIWCTIEAVTPNDVWEDTFWPSKGFDLDDDSSNDKDEEEPTKDEQHPTKEEQLDERKYDSKQTPNSKQINFVGFDLWKLESTTITWHMSRIKANLQPRLINPPFKLIKAKYQDLNKGKTHSYHSPER